MTARAAMLVSAGHAIHAVHLGDVERARTRATIAASFGNVVLEEDAVERSGAIVGTITPAGIETREADEVTL